MVAAVEVEGLKKNFPVVGGANFWRLPFAQPGKRVLEDITFAVSAGEVFGLLGPNGAGKTTLLKILCTLLAPSAGRARVQGFDIVRQAAAARQQLGYCPGSERSFYLRLSGRENLRFYGVLNNVSPSVLAERIPTLLAALGLDAAAGVPTRNYSTGMLQRLTLARALLHQPRVLILDEPTRSLDPVAAAWLRFYIRQELAGQQGCAVVLATHNLAEAEETCDGLLVLSGGRTRALGTLGEICRQAGAKDLADAYRHLASAPPEPEPVAARD